MRSWYDRCRQFDSDRGLQTTEGTAKWLAIRFEPVGCVTAGGSTPLLSSKLMINSHMRLYEFTNDIKFRTVYKNPVTRNFTKQFLSNKLYIRGKIFYEYWLAPEWRFPEGGVFAIASTKNEIIGIAAINLGGQTDYFSSFPEPEDKDVNYDWVGTVGVYIKTKSRRSGVGNHLLKLLERRFLSTFSKYKQKQNIPIVLCDQIACKIGRNIFKKIKVAGIDDLSSDIFQDSVEGVIYRRKQ